MGYIILLRAKRHWKEAIVTILWSFALKAVEDIRNHLKLDIKGWVPIHNYSKVFTNVEIKHWYNAKTQSGHLPKWEPKARVGIYLGHSPCHAGSVALALNLKTLHVPRNTTSFFTINSPLSRTYREVKSLHIGLTWLLIIASLRRIQI